MGSEYMPVGRVVWNCVGLVTAPMKPYQHTCSCDTHPALSDLMAPWGSAPGILRPPTGVGTEGGGGLNFWILKCYV